MRGWNRRAAFDSGSARPGSADTRRLSALRIAARTYGGQVLHTGGAEFQERAARRCARLNIRVVNADLAGIVRDP